MKILFYAWNIYDENFKELPVKPNGGSIAIKNICEYVGRKCEVYLFVGKKKLHAQKIGNINIVDTSECEDCNDVEIDENERWLRTMTNAFEKSVLETKPDFINLQGNGELTKRCILKCIEKKWLYAFTDHLYIGLQKKVEGYDSLVEWEKEVYSIPNIKVTAVGTKMMENINRDFPETKGNVEVIINGTDIVCEEIKSELSERYKIRGKKVLLCIGTIIKRKNQEQVVRAYNLLPESIKKNLVIFFCGVDKLNGAIQREIERLSLSESLFFLGEVPNSEIKKYYSIADGYILPSVAEGLSLTMLEAITYGIPVMMFDDIEGASDLNNKKVVEFIYGKEDQNVADTIKSWYEKEWDKEYIKEYAKYFMMERAADDYMKYFSMRIRENDMVNR